MKLFLDNSKESEFVKLFVSEKKLELETFDVNRDPRAFDCLAEITPDLDAPLLLDRDLVITNLVLIADFLSEKHPAPAVMPHDIRMRARAKQFVHRVQTDYYSGIKPLKAFVRELQQAPLGRTRYLLSDVYSIFDIALAPILNTLDHTAPPAVTAYAERVLQRKACRDLYETDSTDIADRLPIRRQREL